MAFEKIVIDKTGSAWQRKWTAYWPKYRAWFLSEGARARDSYLASRRALSDHMSELLGTYDSLCDLAGGGDLESRFLSFYNPPLYLAGCSQAIWRGTRTRLIRNYDYALGRIDATVLQSGWGGRQVLCMSDGLWGVLDGINEAGLTVSLTFGGRRDIGNGFGIPLIQRYILETCDTVDDAAEVLRAVPSHMAYNITALDASGDHFTAFLAPNVPPVFSKTAAVANHQETIGWKEHARMTASVERERFLLSRLRSEKVSDEAFENAFLNPPLYSTEFSRGFGTAYTSLYAPAERSMELRWPGTIWGHGFFDASPAQQVVSFPG